MGLPNSLSRWGQSKGQAARLVEHNGNARETIDLEIAFPRFVCGCWDLFYCAADTP